MFDGLEKINAEMEDLRRQRERLRKKLDDHKESQKKNGENVTFWVFMGSSAYLFFDASTFGMVSGLFVGVNSIKWLMQRKFAKEVDARINKIEARYEETLKMRIEFEKALELNKSLAVDFSPVAQKQIADLQQELSDLKKFIDGGPSGKNSKKGPYDVPGY